MDTFLRGIEKEQNKLTNLGIVNEGFGIIDLVSSLLKLAQSKGEITITFNSNVMVFTKDKDGNYIQLFENLPQS